MYTDIKGMYDINKERIQLTYTDENFIENSGHLFKTR